MVRGSLEPLLPCWRPGRPLRVLEPACGEGVFLLEAYRYLHAALPQAATDDLLKGLYGLDRDPQSVRRSRQNLTAEVALRGERSDWAELLERNLRCGDALIGPDSDRCGLHSSMPGFAWRREFPDVFVPGSDGFDAVIGNPPYVNIRLLSQHLGEEVKRYFRDRYRCARGGYDLYVLFLELASQLLRPGGVCGMIVPNKLATMSYASACRSLLGEATLLEIADLAGCRVFPGAGVYPYILIWRKQPPPADHTVKVVVADSLDLLAAGPSPRRLPQRNLNAAGGWHLHGCLDVESRVATQALREVAQLHSGSMGFGAAELAVQLQERRGGETPAGFDFVVSGNVDRYVVRRGGSVRFMKRKLTNPVLPYDARGLSQGKRTLYRGSKILIAGLSQRLEAAWDPGGLALGVQLYAAQPAIDPLYLLAILNSKLISYLFRLRFQAKRLSGGYLSINKTQLAALPIRRIDRGNDREVACEAELADLARQRSLLACALPVAEGTREDDSASQSLDRQIDQLVYRLYALSDGEIARVQADYD